MSRLLRACWQAAAEKLRAESEARAAELERCRRQEADVRAALAAAQSQAAQQRQLLEQARLGHAAELQV